MDERVFIGENRPEDVRWLHSLTESELDLLISLKELTTQRAKVVGHESLAEKCDLKMLRTLSFILMQHVKGQINDLQLTEVVGLKEILDGCSFLKLDLEDIDQTLSHENLTSLMEVDKKRRRGSRSSQTTPGSKRTKDGTGMGRDQDTCNVLLTVGNEVSGRGREISYKEKILFSRGGISVSFGELENAVI